MNRMLSPSEQMLTSPIPRPQPYSIALLLWLGPQRTLLGVERQTHSTNLKDRGARCTSRVSTLPSTAAASALASSSVTGSFKSARNWAALASNQCSGRCRILNAWQNVPMAREREVPPTSTVASSADAAVMRPDSASVSACFFGNVRLTSPRS